MDTIRDLTQYKELIRETKRRFGKVDQNSILMSGAVEKYIKNGHLFFREYEHGTVFWIEEGRYYKLYYYWMPGAALDDFRCEKPVVIEELDNHGTRSDYISRFTPTLEAAGFRLYKTNQQVELNPSDPSLGLEERFSAEEARMAMEGLHFHYDDGSHMPQASALWKAHLDLADVPLDHTVLGPDDTLLCVLDGSGSVAATHWWRHTGKSSEGRHTVTHPDYYRRGLASAMLCAWCLDAKQRGIRKASTWISTTNFRSLALYQKVGFTPNGRVSRQYILS